MSKSSSDRQGFGYDQNAIGGFIFFPSVLNTDGLVGREALHGLLDCPCHFKISTLQVSIPNLLNLQAVLGYLKDKWHWD